MKGKWVKVRRLIGLIISFILLIQQALPATIIKAKDISDIEFLRSVAVTDLNGNKFGKDVPLDAGVMLKFHFEAPQDLQIQEGDEFYFNIPNEFKIEGVALDIITSNRDVIGKCTSESKGKLKIKFGRVASEGLNIKGDIVIKTKFDEDELKGGGSRKLEFNILKHKEVVTVDFKVDKSKDSIDSSITKEGKYDEEKDEINWTIKVNSGSERLCDIKLIDTLGEKQKFVDKPIKVDGVEVDNYTIEDNKLNYSFSEKSVGVKTIVITTKPDSSIYTTNDKSATLENTASLVEGKAEKNAQAEVEVPTEIIVKKGSNKGDRKINWTIKLFNRNNNVQRIRVTDVIPSNQKYIAQTLEYNGGTGKYYGVDETEKVQPGTNNILKYEDGVISFEGIPDKVTEISFKTEITDIEMLKKNETQLVTNNAKLTFLGEPDALLKDKEINLNGTANFYNMILIKGDGNIKYNPSKREFNWNIKVNMNQLDLVDPIITDKIEETQELDEESVIVDGEKVELNSEEYSFKDGVLTLKLPDGADKHDIVYKTKIKSNEIYANNKFQQEFNNTVELNTKFKEDITGENHIFAWNTKQKANSCVVDKSGVFDYGDNTINWTISVNRNKMPVKRAEIVDEIPSNQKYVENSFSTNYVDEDKKDKGTFTYEESSDGDSSGKITYYFGDDEINDEYIIKFKTKIVDEESFFSEDYNNGKGVTKKVENKVKLTGDVIPENVVTTGTCNIEIAPVRKNCEYKQNTDYIKWSVLLNGNSVKLGHASMTDNLNKYLKLDTSTIRLFKLKGPEGKLPSKDDISEEIELTKKEIQYDKKNNVLKVNLNDIDAPYLLEYITYIDPQAINDKVQNIANDASFDGVIVKGKSVAEAKNVYFISGSGIGSIERGFIKVRKLDEENKKPIEGTKFQLYDRFEELVAEGKTDKDGIIKFSNVGYNVSYFIKEEAAAEGYLIDEENNYRKAEKVNSKEREVTCEWTNKPIKGTVQVKKVKSHDIASILSNAKFVVYRDDNDDKIPDGDVEAVLSEDMVNKGTYSADLRYGRYLLKEETAPEGYTEDPEYYPFFIEEDGKTVTVANDEKKVNFTNDLIKGSVQVNKVDSTDTTKKLSGAEFKIYKDINGNKSLDDKDKLIETLSEVSTGVYKSTKYLTYGRYFLKEVTAPEGYKEDNKEYEFFIKENEKNVIVANDEKKVNFMNEPMLGRVEVTKVDSSDTDKKLSGAVFKVYKDSNNDGTLDSNDELIEALSENSTGVYTNRKDLTCGDYFLKEEKAPEGYDAEAEEKKFSIKGDGQVEKIVFKNDLIKGSVQVNKVDSTDTTKKLSGAEFKIYKDSNDNKSLDKDDELIETLSEASTGVYKNTKDLIYGRYFLKEEKAPEGYIKDDEEHELFIKEARKNVIVSNDKDEVNFTNAPMLGGVEVTKVDSKDVDKKLEGAVFNIYKYKNAQGDYESVGSLSYKGEGVYSKNELRYGDYFLKEEKAPEGYKVDTNEYKFSIKENTQVEKISLTNNLITGSVQVNKVDSTNKDEKLSGAIFKVYKDSNDNKSLDKDDELIETLSEVSIGEYKSTKDLTYGRYFLKEETAPEGYKEDTGDYEFFIKKDDVTVTVTNDKDKVNFTNEPILGGIQVTKLDSKNSSKKLEGAAFNVYKYKNAEGDYEFVGSLSYDGDGVYCKNDLTYGDYFLKEETAPEGYNIDLDKHEFSIKKDTQFEKISLINDLITGSVGLTKVDSINKDKKLSGAVFKVYKDSNYNKSLDKDDELIETLSEISIGEYKSTKDLTYGRYFLKEETAPEGYKKDDKEYEFFIKEGGKTVIVSNDKEENNFINEKYDGKLEILINDNKSKKSIEGVTVEVYDEYNTVVYRGKTDKDGKIKVDGLKNGSYKYKIVEIKDEYTVDKLEDKMDVAYGEIAKKELKVNEKEVPSKPQITQKDEKPKVEESKGETPKAEEPKVEMTKEVVVNHEEGKAEDSDVEKDDKVENVENNKTTLMEKTGDNSKLGILIVISICSLAVIIAIAISSKRKRKL